MIAKLNFYNKDKLFASDYTEDFQTETSLREYFNKIKSFIVKDSVLNLEHYEIREVNDNSSCDVDVDIYCNILAEVKSEKNK
ncbi:hypothetical protein [Methanobrevibacter arboriphilus]|uniref:hypothetical protein n=1 Tax=Methanobrevibacter arboriphilus TaxID=39441 RepID=UPI000AC40981|nr:hypothetical protein [Methanobrevibacter arboriphilus]